MHGYHWTRSLDSLYHEATRRYGAGVRTPEALFTPEEAAALATIGAVPIELYDYVEDAHSLDWLTGFGILCVRRDYFLNVQNGVPSPNRLTRADFPGKRDELEGIVGLPRLMLKAHCRLRGELPLDMMYGCGMDRSIFEKYDLHPVDFLRFYWSVGGEVDAILACFRKERPCRPLAPDDHYATQ